MARQVAERHDVVPMLGEVFRRYGFEGTSMARITAQTKFGKGSLYNFFPGGKDEMAEAILAHIHEWFEAEIFAPLERDPPNEAIERMFVGVETYFRSGRRVCLVGAFALEETRDRFFEAVGGYFRRWLEALANAIERLGTSRPEATRLSRETVAGIQGAIVLSRALDNEEQFIAILKTLRIPLRLKEGGDDLDKSSMSASEENLV